jgi:copper chaperone
MMTLKIQGMTSMHCVKAVTQALNVVPGVSGIMAVSLENGHAIVDGTASVASLIDAVKKVGYTAEQAG